MPPSATPFALPSQLSPDLTRVLAYWNGLKRGQAEMPFWDDVRLAELPGLAGRLALIDVFEAPQRFRFGVVGQQLDASQPSPLAGRFLDEIELDAPLDELRVQCAAAARASAPTFAQSGVGRGGRLVLPLWGEGQIHMLLVALD